VRIRSLSVSLALTFCAYGQTPAPDAAGQMALIAKMRDAALNYESRLQDFICTQLTTRTTTTTQEGQRENGGERENGGQVQRWKLLETQEVELSYVAHKENPRLLKVNGDSKNPEKKIKKNHYRPTGQFGTALLWIFNPKVSAEFQWDRSEMLDGKRLCVFRYRVPQATTSITMFVNKNSVKLGHHGFVSADCDTGDAMRIQIETDPATVKMFGRQVPVGTKLDVRYAWTKIGDDQFLLPQEAVETGLYNDRRTKAETKFEQYRKYKSSSTITFGEADKAATPPPR
jgi:hypothetical protein